jgi:hypothetical protein
MGDPRNSASEKAHTLSTSGKILQDQSESLPNKRHQQQAPSCFKPGERKLRSFSREEVPFATPVPVLHQDRCACKRQVGLEGQMFCFEETSGRVRDILWCKSYSFR